MEFIHITIQGVHPAMTGFNLGCVDEVNVDDLNDIPFFDGKNHPLDQKK